ncbi:hypothetical protein ACF0H5_017556 [Mactra antiquata]
MPICYISTNLKDDKVAGDLEDKLQECIAEVLNKPSERITVTINTGLRMKFNGERQPGLLCQLRSIGVFDKERNPSYFPHLFHTLTKATGLPPSSITIEFVDIPAYMVMNGSALSSK